MASILSGNCQPCVSSACASWFSWLQVHNYWCTNCLPYLLVQIIIKPSSAEVLGDSGVPLCDVVWLVTWVSWWFSSEKILWIEPGSGWAEWGLTCATFCVPSYISWTLAVPAVIIIDICWSLFVRLVQPTMHLKGKSLPHCCFLSACYFLLVQ